MAATTARLFFEPEFDTLIGYAHHRLAQTVTYGGPPELFQCEVCGRIEPRTHGNQTKYHSPTCREKAKKRRSRERLRAKT